MALSAVVFDVGETLVDEERWWRELCRRGGLQPHVVWAALGVTIERGEEHTALWDHLGVATPPACRLIAISATAVNPKKIQSANTT